MTLFNAIEAYVQAAYYRGLYTARGESRHLRQATATFAELREEVARLVGGEGSGEMKNLTKEQKARKLYVTLTISVLFSLFNFFTRYIYDGTPPGVIAASCAGVTAMIWAVNVGVAWADWRAT